MPRIVSADDRDDFTRAGAILLPLGRRLVESNRLRFKEAGSWVDANFSEEATRAFLIHQRDTDRLRISGQSTLPPATAPSRPPRPRDHRLVKLAEGLRPDPNGGDALRAARLQRAVQDLWERNRPDDHERWLSAHLPRVQRETNARVAMVVSLVLLDPDGAEYLAGITDLAQVTLNGSGVPGVGTLGRLAVVRAWQGEALELLWDAIEVLSPAANELVQTAPIVKPAQSASPPVEAPDRVEAARHLVAAAERLENFVRSVPLTYRVRTGEHIEYNSTMDPSHVLDPWGVAGDVWGAIEAIDRSLRALRIANRDGETLRRGHVGEWEQWLVWRPHPAVVTETEDVLRFGKQVHSWYAVSRTAGNYPRGCYYVRLPADATDWANRAAVQARALARTLAPGAGTAVPLSPPLTPAPAGRRRPRRKRKAPLNLPERPLTPLEVKTLEVVSRHKQNFTAAAAELQRHPKTVRENYVRALAKANRITGHNSRSVDASALPTDRRGQVNL